MADQEQPLEALAEAIRAFVATLDTDEPCVVMSAVVAFETTRFMGDGAQGFRVLYSQPVGSLAAGVGVLEVAKQDMLNDLLGGDDDD